MQRIVKDGKVIKIPTPRSKWAWKNKKYEEQNKVVEKQSFDVVIIIPSYNRITKLKRILRQLNSQPTDYTFKLIVLNDGSTRGQYSKLKDKYDIDYLENQTNEAKKGYWKTINKLFEQANKYKAKVLIQIDDDFILADNFINSIMELFLIEKPMAIMYHYSDVKQTRWNLGTNWLDGGVVLSYKFLNKIRFKIDPIDHHRFDEHPELSSGVWLQISRKLNQFKEIILKPTTSLAYHDGNDDSKMNWMCREERKINTKNFNENNPDNFNGIAQYMNGETGIEGIEIRYERTNR